MIPRGEAGWIIVLSSLPSPPGRSVEFVRWLAASQLAGQPAGAKKKEKVDDKGQRISEERHTNRVHATGETTEERTNDPSRIKITKANGEGERQREGAWWGPRETSYLLLEACSNDAVIPPPSCFTQFRSNYARS